MAKKEDVFEIRIPNLRKDEIPIVREAVRKFTKELLNSLQAQRNKELTNGNRGTLPAMNGSL